MSNMKILKVILVLLAFVATRVQCKHHQQFGYRQNRNSGKFYLFMEITAKKSRRIRVRGILAKFD